MKYLLLLILISPAIFSCTTQKNNQSQATSTVTDTIQPYVLKYDRGPCFGQCPVYTFYLLSDHTGLVNSKANLMPESGWYHTQLDQEAIAEILELVEPLSWWTPDLRDQPEIADMPSSHLSYWHKDGLRTISIQSRTSHSVEIVFGKLGHLVSEARWAVTDLRPVESPEQPQTNVIVQLKPGVEIESWMKKFDRFGIHLIKRLTPNQAYYVVAKDESKGSSNDFLQYIKRDADVIDAQWDRAVGKRE